MNSEKSRQSLFTLEEVTNIALQFDEFFFLTSKFKFFVCKQTIKMSVWSKTAKTQIDENEI